MNITKVFNGIKKRDNWESFNWTVTIKGVECDYSLGLGHCKIATKRPEGYVYKELSHPEIDKKINSLHYHYIYRLYIRIPRVRDVLYSLAMDAACARDSFEDFCSNLGYDTDSRRALRIYLDCQESGHKLRRMGYDLDRILAWQL